jgi:Mg-chelatase subunit ChlD
MTSIVRDSLGARRRITTLLLALALAVAILVVSDGGLRIARAGAQDDGGASCGIDLAMVLDSSGSIDPTELSAMKDAFGVMTDAFLPATPSELAVVDFDRKGRVVQDFTTDRTAVDSAIAGITSGGRTNWQDAIRKARRLFPNQPNPDVIVFASDGRPNKVGGSNDFNRPLALQKAINQANKAKAAGIHIVAIGIGDKLRVDKLEAIATSPSDVYTTDFDTLAETLADLAGALCPSTITINKVIDADGNLGTTGDQTPGADWEFTPTVAGAASDPSSGWTAGDGSLTFTVTPGGATVDIAETVANPWTLLDAQCSGATDNGTSDGLDSVDGIVTSPGDAVTCTFINYDETPPTS